MKLKTIKHSLAVSVSIALTGCGGGDVDQSHAEWSAGERALAAAAPEDGRVAMFATFNYERGSSYTTAGYFLHDLVAILDQERIPIWADQCYWIKLPDGVGVPSPQPTLLAIRVKAEHQARLEALGLRKIEGDLPPAQQGSDCGVDWVGSATKRAELFARKFYPDYFYGPPQASETEIPGWFDYGPYRYTYFPASGNYLGLIGDEVYVHNGRDWNFLHVGNIRDFIPSFVTNSSAAASSSSSSSSRMAKL